MRVLKITFFALTFWLCYSFVGCSPVAFSGSSVSGASVTCNGTGQTCTSASGVNSFNYTVTVPQTLVDILFVVDNTASMSAIQTQIGSRFPNFIQSLNGISYQLGITTTDISSSTDPSYAGNGPSPANGQGALQSGNLIAFPDGSKVLTPTSNSSNPAPYFLSTIQRPETLSCEAWLATPAGQACEKSNQCAQYSQFCPSEDSRGIYAANLVIQNNPSGLLRANVPLAVVIISNSDERNSGGRLGINLLAALDEPASLQSTLTAQFQSTKTMTVQSIVIDPALNGNCLQQQTFSSVLFGWPGSQYIAASNATGGAVGDVCATNYTQQMGQIATNIATQLNTISLGCAPINNKINITLNPPDASANPQLSTTNNQLVQFAHTLATGTQVNLQYQCDLPSGS